MPEYRLQALYDIRQRAEKEAQDRLTEEQKKLAAEQKKLQARLARRDELTQKMRSGQMSVQKIQEEYRFLDRMQQEITAMDDVIYRQEQALRAQEVEVQSAKEVLLEKTKELKALEKHK